VTTSVRTISTAYGDARLHTDRSRHPAASLVLGHGAGAGVDSADLLALARALPGLGISVYRVEQPWHVAGRKVAHRPEVLDAATIACVNGIRARTPMVLGGRSAGARVACRLARQLGAVGCLALSFPLHPPGKPDMPGNTRLPELLGARVPVFVVQGERDAFGGPDAFPESVELTVVPEADHGLKVPRRAALTQDETHALVVEAVVEWVTARVG
jgi:predicted alpha/beta-hydrolase family hydrolase